MNVRGVWLDGQGRLYAVDEGNSRILIFNNAATLPDGANADNVIGQADFTSGSAPSPPTAGSLAYPNSMYIDNSSNHIWVADAGNNRVLRYDVQLGTTEVDNPTPVELPSEYVLAQNFPNPFNPSTTIAFRLRKSEHATVTVHNLMGQIVATLFDGVALANERYAVSFNASNLASGIYVYTLRSASVLEAKKMVLMK